MGAGQLDSSGSEALAGPAERDPEPKASKDSALCLFECTLLPLSLQQKRPASESYTKPGRPEAYSRYNQG